MPSGDPRRARGPGRGAVPVAAHLRGLGWETEKGLRAKQDYAFGADGHGLVVLGADGRLLTCRPGHSYGAREIRDDFDRALGR